MTVRVTQGYQALTEKEKQTLRLIVRGHDAKSIARCLGLSVHTINERLREARRKMAVSSSREAARLLLDVEGDGRSATPESLGDRRIGEASGPPITDHDPGPTDRPFRITIGVALMTIALALLALTALPQLSATTPQESVATAKTPDPVVVDAARQWLLLVDAGRWDDSYRATGAVFQRLNTLERWTSVSQKVRVPLGATLSRTVIGQENLPAPPNGFEVVKFRTSFANKADTIETVTLDQEDGVWRVVGVTIG